MRAAVRAFEVREYLLPVLYQLIEAVKANGTHWKVAPEHVDYLHRQIQPRGGSVQRDAQVGAAEQ